MAYKLIADQPKSQPQENIVQNTDFLKSAIQRTGDFVQPGVSLAANTLAQVGGLPGDLLSLGRNAIERPLAKALDNKEISRYEDTPFSYILPTSQQARSNIQSTFPYTKPRDELSRAINEIGETVSDLFTTGAARTGVRIGKKLLSGPAKAIGTSILAQGAKEGTKYITGSESKGEAAKGAVTLGGVMFNPQGAIRSVNQSYSKAIDALKSIKNPNLPIGNQLTLTKDLTSLRNELGKKVGSDASQTTNALIDEIVQTIGDKPFPIADLPPLLKGVNERLGNELAKAATNKTRRSLRANYKRLNGIINKSLEDFGKKNPSFGVPFAEAQKGYGVIEESKFLKNVIEKNLNIPLNNKWLPHAFGTAVTGAATKLSPASLGAVGVYQLAKFAYRFKNSKLLQRYYKDAITSALKDDAVAYKSNLKKLDDEVSKQEKNKSKFKLI